MTAETRLYHIEGMDCANCAHELETSMGRLPGVAQARVDFATATLAVEGDVAFADLQARAQALGKSLASPVAEAAIVTRTGGVRGFVAYLLSRAETRLAVAGGGLILLTLAFELAGGAPALVAPAYTVAMLIALYPILKSGLYALRFNRSFNINLLMSIAAIGAILIGEYLEGATVICLFAVGEALEGYTADQARASVRDLMRLKPATALRLDSAGHETRIPADQVHIGDSLLIRPGEDFPVDAVILGGASHVNQAAITGESVPVLRGAGDAVYAGAVNGEGTLTVQATRHADDSAISRIIRLVAEAQSVRAPSQRLIDDFARFYTPAVVLIALGIALGPPLLLGAPFFDTTNEQGWLYRALALLVIACPCALVISTPVTIISALTAAARRGVLIKGGAHLEALATVRAIAFDKTGTLTQGQPVVQDYRAVACYQPDACADCDEVLALAAAVEGRVSHPLGQAIVRAAHERPDLILYPLAEGVEALAGRGVRGHVNDQLITVGSHRYFDEAFPHDPALCEQITTAEARGWSTMMLAEGERVRGWMALADVPRPNSEAVLADLAALGLPTILLTGDHALAAQAIAGQIGVGDVRADLLPEDKVAAVHALRAQYGPVAMVGDGINDTPALATATVGIAMGGAGTPQALETADIALMADDLAQLPFAIRLARFVRVLIRQNVGLSLAMKAGFMALAITGGASLWLAILADVGMSLLVTLNGMRPLRLAPRARPDTAG